MLFKLYLIGTEYCERIAIITNKPKQGSVANDEKNTDSLDKRIGQAEHHHANPEKAHRSRARMPADAMALIGRIATELVAGIAVGTFIGWMLDQWLGTLPLFMIILFFLGAMAGMVNIWRMATGQGLKLGYFDQHRPDQNDKN